MLKKFAMRFVSALIVAVMIIPTINIISSAAIVEWDGKSPLSKGATYQVTKELYVKNAATVPEGTILYVLEGGNLLLPVGTKLTVEGELAVAKEGQVFVSGDLNVKGKYELYGTMQASVGANFFLSGETNIYSAGLYKTSGNNTFYEGSKLYSKGVFSVLKSGEAISAAAITLDNKSEFNIYGNMAIAVSGSISNKGNISVYKTGVMKNSGNFVIEIGGAFENRGDLSNTKSGKFTDKNTGVNYEAMYSTALANAERVSLIGIDVSVHNGDINWRKVKASGVEFAMLRAGRGYYNDEYPMTEDDRFREYLGGAEENLIDVGVYFYSYAKTLKEIRAEARYLVEILQDCNITFPVALDMEEKITYYEDDPGKMAEAFMKIIMDAGYFPMMYSSRNWLVDNMTYDFLNKYSVWVAHTNTNSTSYPFDYFMWQNSHTGKVSGITGEVDLNIAYRDFAKYIRKNRLNNLQ